MAPARELGAAFEADAAAAIVEYTQGYPFFLQEYGKVIWDEADSMPFTAATVETVRPLVEARLDASFFRVRAERVTAYELCYLRAMAELGPGPQKASDVAAVMGRESAQVGPTRSRLVDKGLLYTPGYGLAAFTVPQFDRYLVRAYALDA